MFSLETFIKNGLLNSIGKWPEYKIILNAAGWLDKGVLTEEDLSDIQEAIDKYNTPIVKEQEVPEEENGFQVLKQQYEDSEITSQELAEKVKDGEITISQYEEITG